MPEYEFSESEDISDYVSDEEEIVSVRYMSGTEFVETERPDDTDLGGMTRQELYSVAKGLGADVNWSGDDADTKEYMKEKIKERKAEGDSNE